MFRKRQDVLKEIESAGIATAKEDVARAYDKYFDPDCWRDSSYKRLPAELATLFKMFTTDGPTISKSDKIVFLCGEKNIVDAVFCWYAMKMLAKEHLLLTNPDEQVLLHKPPFAWNPTNQHNFITAMDALWKLVIASLPLRMVLTGGFKGVLLDLAVRRGRHHPFNGEQDRFYYLHENGDEFITYFPSSPTSVNTTRV